MISPHVFFSRLYAPLLARRRRSAARALFRFAHAEIGSAVILRRAAQRTQSDAHRVAFLLHALDEERHCRMFSRRAAELNDDRSLGPVRRQGPDLFRALGERRFLAFLHRAEQRGRREFEGYRDAFAGVGDSKTSGLFSAILRDEARHESYSLALLSEVCDDAAEVRRVLRRVALWEAGQLFQRIAARTSHALFGACMLAVYVLVSPLALLVRRARTDGGRLLDEPRNGA